MEPAQTALIVAVPQAEPAVARWRARLDPSAAWGVPAHVTLLYPFLPPGQIDRAVLTALEATVRTVPRFAVTFRRVEWFGESVLWLAPEPDHPLRALTVAVWHRFPQTPPYGGLHPDAVPHLTVAERGPLDVMRAAAVAVRSELPIEAAVSTVQLLAGSAHPHSWRVLAELRLG